MRIHYLGHYLSLLGVVLCVSALADKRPTLPENSEDAGLTGGKPAAEFFEARKSNTACRKNLETVRAKSLQSRKELRKLVDDKAPADQIDAKEEESQADRDSYLEVMRECGECAVNGIKYVTIRPEESSGDTEYWTIADGSCHLPQSQWVDSNGLARASEFLLNIGKYPGRKGGFSAIIDMIGEGNTPKVEKSPFHSFIMVRGPVILGLVTGFSYPFVNVIPSLENGNQKDFSIQFTSEDPHPSVQIPAKFLDYSASGRATKVKERRLKEAIGKWYVTNDGYVRYYTAGNFGRGASLADSLAIWILSDTLATAAEVVAGTERP